MRKNNICFLAAIAALCASSCNTEVPVDEISPLLTFDTRCKMSGGRPLTIPQAKKIAAIVATVNNVENDYSDPDTAECPEAYHGQCRIIKSTAAGTKDSIFYNDNITEINKQIRNYRTTLKGAKLLYESALMYDIYKYVAENLYPGDTETASYCACGYQFCDQNVACSIDDVSHMPICAANTSVDPEMRKDCNPVNIKQTGLINILMAHQMPLLQKLGSYRSFASANIGLQNAESKYSTQCNNYKAVTDSEKGHTIDCSVEQNSSNIRCLECNEYYNAYFNAYVINEGIQAQYDNARISRDSLKAKLGSDYDSQLSNCNNSIPEVCNTTTGAPEYCDVCKREANFNKISLQYKDIMNYVRDGEKASEHRQDILDTANKNKGILEKVGSGDEKALFTCDGLTGDSQKTCITALGVYMYLINCMNVASLDIASQNKCLGFKRDCLDTQNNRTQVNGSPQACTGEVFINGAMPHSSEQTLGKNYYIILKSLAAYQLGIIELGENKTLTKEEDNKVRDYLIEQMSSIFVSASSSDMRGVIDNVKEQYVHYLDGMVTQTDFADTIFTALKQFFKDTYQSTDENRNKLHREFFAWITVNGLSDTEVASLYTSTFSVRLECVDQTNLIGDPSGTKKYCITRENRTYTLADILGLMQSDKQSIVDMSDAMIMGSDAVFYFDKEKKEDGDYVRVNVKESKIYEYYNHLDENGKESKDPLALEGDWLILRCPDNASCHPASQQCGSCTNGDTKKDANGIDTAVCSGGVWKPVIASTN